MPLPLSPMSDEELMAEVQNDDQSAFNLLVGRYKDPLTNFVYRFVGDREDCNDIVQDTFIRMYRSRKSYKPVARFSTWIFTIASNLAKSRLRQGRLRRVLTLTRRPGEPDPVFDLPEDAPRADVRTDASIREEKIQQALNALPVCDREVVVLRDVQEQSVEEIAALTKLPMGTVKSRINRGRAMLQKMLEDLLGN